VRTRHRVIHVQVFGHISEGSCLPADPRALVERSLARALDPAAAVQEDGLADPTTREPQFELSAQQGGPVQIAELELAAPRRRTFHGSEASRTENRDLSDFDVAEESGLGVRSFDSVDPYLHISIEGLPALSGSRQRSPR
jgi:hypothetical protein